MNFEDEKFSLNFGDRVIVTASTEKEPSKIINEEAVQKRFKQLKRIGYLFLVNIYLYFVQHM